MNNVVVVVVIRKINIFEFNEMFNKGEQIFSISTKRSFFDARVFNDMLLVYEIQYYCKDSGIRNELDAVLDIVQRRLYKNAVLISFRKDEGMCENIYHYIFLLK
jgi:hypothetical protein